MKSQIKKILLLAFLLFIGSCAYYNTFFNAKLNYNEALKAQKNSKSTRKLSGNIKQKYQKAIEKSWKLIKIYGDSNKYADDALLLIGKAYYQMGDYLKAERTLTQFLQKYLRSEHIPEAKLWLARIYIAQDRKDEALGILNTLLSEKLPRNLAARAFYILGELYYEQEDYPNAIKYLEQCVRVTHDDGMKGDALYMMGEAYYSLEDYNNSMASFLKLSKLDIPPIREYEAKAKVVESLIELKRYDEAENILKKMLRSQRFKKQYSLIETRLANLYEIQGQTDFALDYYYEIIHKYPRSEGASLCYYYLGQLYEFEYGNLDSAKFYYDKVKNLKSQEEVAKEAKQKSTLLAEYLKIRNQLRKDRSDIFKLEHGDSSLTDSMEVAGDSVAIDSTEQQHLTDLNAGIEAQDKLSSGQQSTAPTPQAAGFIKQPSLPDTSKARSDSLKKAQAKIKKKVKKVAITLIAEQVRESFRKNSFALGEFFLLKYQNYDSAAYAYKNFVQLFDNDSILTPKAYYALYFIYHDLEHDSLKADSLKQLIIQRYPNTIYGKKLLGIVDMKTPEEQVSQAHTLYENAEDLMEQQKYDQAIMIFRQIAEQDSGSVWAQKSRYAIAYIYEHYLKDVDNAVKAYSKIIKEYPDTKYALIAKKKVAPPPPEPKPEERTEEQQPIGKANAGSEPVEKAAPVSKPSKEGENKAVINRPQHSAESKSSPIDSTVRAPHKMLKPNMPVKKQDDQK
ncbi:hypothetical protein DRI50_02455 [candidate division KSB1 bacterium]|nr:MAG: hypothetical protein DRI50_02455 [candidate division KSB1 bacterium]